MIKPLCYLSWPLQLDFCDIFFFSLSDNEFKIYKVRKQSRSRHKTKSVIEKNTFLAPKGALEVMMSYVCLSVCPCHYAL